MMHLGVAGAVAKCVYVVSVEGPNVLRDSYDVKISQK
jgi:hypothetical protein